MLNKKEEILHIAKLTNTTCHRNPGELEIYIPRTAILNWLRSCALAESTTEIPRNTVKAIISAIETWKAEE